jgi:uncharacterized protein YigE (DUF2233 family)
MGRVAALLLLLVVSAPTAGAAACRGEEFEGARYTICSSDLAKSDLRMFWRSAEGAPYRTFPALAADLAKQGLALSFAMNGGMYDAAFAPIGLYIEAGQELAPANTKIVSGAPAEIPNFYKKPNGVFLVKHGSAAILTTDAFLADPPTADFATQSGPMLVIGGKIHPAFIVGSTDRKVRNGVGLSLPTMVHLAISEDRVNFYDFARFFRDRLGCANALFLDGGTAPGLFAPELDRADAPGHGGYGPIIGVVD